MSDKKGRESSKQRQHFHTDSPFLFFALKKSGCLLLWCRWVDYNAKTQKHHMLSLSAWLKTEQPTPRSRRLFGGLLLMLPLDISHLLIHSFYYCAWETQTSLGVAPWNCIYIHTRWRTWRPILTPKIHPRFYGRSNFSSSMRSSKNPLFWVHQAFLNCLKRHAFLMTFDKKFHERRDKRRRLPASKENKRVSFYPFGSARCV